MDRIRRIAGREDGQAAPEYAGVVLLVATLLSIVLTMAGSALPGGSLARALASKLVCAVGSAGACGEEAAALDPSSPTEAVYGSELAAMLDERAPEISFEPDDFVSLPVDYRECRNRSCADSIRHGSLEHTQTGLEPTVFTHVIDCRDPEAAAAAEERAEMAAPLLKEATPLEGSSFFLTSSSFLAVSSFLASSSFSILPNTTCC